MKRCIVYVLLLSMVLAMLPFYGSATETEAVSREPGMCGENLYWSYDSGTLTVSGSGNMDDYEEGAAPWQEYKDSITKVVLSGSVTGVGAYAFMDYDNLTAVEFGNALVTIGRRAFKSCDGIFRIVLPETFRKFDEECFMGCQRLAEIWCQGGMPSFKASCIWDVSATIFYPPAKAWPPEYVIPLGDAFRWKIQFQTMDVPQEYLTTSPEPATEPVQTEPAATEPAATESAATVPETTVPETTVPETTIPETVAAEPMATETEETKPAWMEEMEELEKDHQESEEETQKKPVVGLGLIVGLCILIVILLLILIGALVFRRRPY